MDASILNLSVMRGNLERLAAPSPPLADVPPAQPRVNLPSEPATGVVLAQAAPRRGFTTLSGKALVVSAKGRERAAALLAAHAAKNATPAASLGAHDPANNVATGPNDLDRYLMPPPPPRALSRVLAPPPETGCSAQAPLDPSFGLQNDKSVAESALSSEDTVMVPSDLVTDESMTMLRGDVAHGDGEQEASTPAPAPSHVAPLTTTSIEQAVDGPTPMVCEAETHAEGVPDQSSTPRSTPASPAAPPSPPRAPPPPPSLPPLVGDGHAMAPAAEPTVAEATTSIDAPLGAPSPSTSHMHLFKPVDITEADPVRAAARVVAAAAVSAVLAAARAP